MGTVRPVEVVEAFPFDKFLFKVEVGFVAEQVIEFLLVGSV